MSFLNRRVGFDVSYYNNQNINQITAIPLSTSTGYLCFIEPLKTKVLKYNLMLLHLKLLISDGI
jgi:hypothetical protein